MSQKLIWLGVAASLFMHLNACSSKSSSQDRQETRAPQDSAATPEDDSTKSPRPGAKEPGPDEAAKIDELKTKLKEAYTAYWDDCKQNTKAFAFADKYYIGAAVGDASFTNFAGVFIGCESDLGETIDEQLDQLAEIDEDEAFTYYDSLIEENRTETDAFFSAEAAKVTVTLGDGLTEVETQEEDFPGESFVTFQATAAGDTSISFSYNGETLASTVTVYGYTAEQLTRGETVYTSGDGTTSACAGCHQADGGADHSANLIGRCSDIEIAGAITNAAYAPDATNPNSECTDYELSLATHKFTYTDEADLNAVMAYLRSLPLERPEGDEEAAAE